MDLDSMSALAQLRGDTAAAALIPASLYELRDRLVGRVLVDARERVVGQVEDVLVTPREKIPRQLVVRLPRRRLWWPRGEVVVYPFRGLLRADAERLQARHSAGVIRRLLDYRPEFARPGEDAECISLGEYLSFQFGERADDGRNAEPSPGVDGDACRRA